MKIQRFFLSIMLLCIGAVPAFTQSTFNLDDYYQFLNNHANMQSQDILGMYPPHTPYWSRTATPTDLASYEYFDSIRIKYELTDDELASLNDRHFVVSERLHFGSMGDAFIDVFHKDLPVFISTDAILHALHRSYDEILKLLEIQILEPDLHAVLDALYAAYPELLSRYQSNPEMEKPLEDVDLYITMAKSLLEGTEVTPQYATAAFVHQYWEAVQAESFATMPLFTESYRYLDFSQFTVRGHYTDDPVLSKYLQSMMWLGRMDFLLANPPADPPITEEDVARMNVASVLLTELLDNSGMSGKLNEMDNIIEFMVGESDNLTTGELSSIITDEGLQGADDLLTESVYSSFSTAVEQSPYSDQKILSSIFMYDPVDEPPPLPVSFRLLGQRFIIDSYVFSKVVFPWIRYQGENIWRPMPDPLDAMFALGNDDALQLVEDELDTYKYATALASVRYLIDAFNEEFWSESLYNIWLNSIRSLNPPADDTNLPFFMKTTGWHQQKLNTQLASWAQLRHDNLLYAKQSYTGGWVCSYPHGYVEPYPEFYNQLENFADRAGLYFALLDAQNDGNIACIVNYFTRLGSLADTLGTLASKELAGTSFTQGEKDFLKRTLTSEWISFPCGPSWPADGWYVELFFGEGDIYKSSKLTYENDYIVADVHTQPTDEFGAPVGRILHVGVGDVNLGVYLVEQTHDPSPYRAYVGPAMSYYEKITDNFDRLTDERWFDMFDTGEIPERPDWVNVYLIDSAGTAYSLGRELNGELYYADYQRDVTLPARFTLAQNYPNPFNPITVIGFSLPQATTVRLTVYDILGRNVRHLIDRLLGSGYHQVIWNGVDNSGRMSPSGVYIYQLRAGNLIQSRRMVLLK